MLSNEQIEKMSDEARAKYLERAKKVQRNRRILTVFLTTVVVLGVAAALSLTVLFNISSISVKNKGKIYTEQEILSASGIDVGDNMIRTNFKSTATRIETMLPYVLKANISKSLSGSVTISVTDNTASIIFKVKSGYAIADKQGKVLELVPEIPEKNILMVLKTKNELKAEPGRQIGFSDEYEKKLYDNLCTALTATKLYEGITEIDISNPLNISVIYQNRMRIKLGSSEQLSDKLSGASKAIELENNNNPTTVAEVDATIPKKVYVNPVDSLNEPETEPDTEPADAEVTDGEEGSDEDTTDTSDENTTETSNENSSTDEGENDSSDSDESDDSNTNVDDENSSTEEE